MLVAVAVAVTLATVILMVELPVVQTGLAVLAELAYLVVVMVMDLLV